MTIREMYENLEKEMLSKYACLSVNTKGRQMYEEKCPIRTDFARDKDRIIHSKAFRRLKHKTQVFISPDNDHFRTRLTHTLEVSQIARTIARALKLNEDLTEAICVGHDLGHTPFGHIGETMLNELSPNGFKHYKQSLRVVDCIEKDGKGLNLTYEVRDGILNHTGDNQPETYEGIIVKYADKFAYLNHDIDDAIRAGMLSVEDIPQKFLDSLGRTHSGRINTLISDIITQTNRHNVICMTEELERNMYELKKFMFDNVYVKFHSQNERVKMVIEKIYNYVKMYPEKLPEDYKKLLDNADIDTVACDYIASMSDGYIIKMYNELFMPHFWSSI